MPVSRSVNLKKKIGRFSLFTNCLQFSDNIQITWFHKLTITYILYITILDIYVCCIIYISCMLYMAPLGSIKLNKLIEKFYIYMIHYNFKIINIYFLNIWTIIYIYTLYIYTPFSRNICLSLYHIKFVNNHINIYLFYQFTVYWI